MRSCSHCVYRAEGIVVSNHGKTTRWSPFPFLRMPEKIRPNSLNLEVYIDDVENVSGYTES